MNISVSVQGCDADTDFELVCTDEQYAFLKELAKATKAISFYDCMPIIELSDSEDAVDVSSNSENLRFIEVEDEQGDDCSHYVLDTTKL